MTEISPGTGQPRCLAVVLGVTPSADGLARPSLDAHRHLEHAEAHAAALGAVLRDSFHYELAAPAGQPITTAADVERIVDQALAESEDMPVVLIHLLGHAVWQPPTFKDRGHLYLIGPDSQPLATPVDDWLAQAQPQPPGARQALFVVDCCESGRLIGLLNDEALEVRDRRHWVIAACRPDQMAYDNRLTTALTDVLTAFATGHEQVDKSVPHISLDVVIRRVDRLVDDAVRAAAAAGQRSPQKVHLTWAPIGTDLGHIPFFRNPCYEPSGDGRLLDGVAPLMRPAVEQIVDSDYFQGLASGSRGPVPGARFTFRGRMAELDQLRAWADARQPALRVVTGKPGVGKSALIGVVVCASLPRLRSQAKKDLGYLARLPPVIPDLAVIHARRHALADVTGAVAHQWELDQPDREGSWAVEEIIEAIQGREQPPTLIIDALDEAQNPEDLLAALVMPMATAVRPGDGAPVCRMLVGVRPESRFEPLLAMARATAGYLDLGAVSADQLRLDLEAYVQVLLLAGEGWPYGSTTLADTFAEEVARALTTAAPLACGEFLIAGLYVRHLLRHAMPPSSRPRRSERLWRACPGKSPASSTWISAGKRAAPGPGPSRPPWPLPKARGCPTGWSGWPPERSRRRGLLPLSRASRSRTVHPSGRSSRR
jgi:hypothetical protein